MYKLIMGIAAAVACLAALGCGSGGDEATSAPLTKAEFTKQANAICTKASEENREDLKEVLGSLKRTAAIDNEEARVSKGLEEVIAPSMLRVAEELEGLTAPEKDQAKVAKMIDNLSKSGRIIAAEGWRGTGGSGFSQFQREAEEYGLDSCLGWVYS
jgi:hypothetical protein